MAFLNSFNIVGSALTAERFRSDIILQNLANANTTSGPDGEPYRRRQVVFEERAMDFQSALRDEQKKLQSGGVRVTEIVENQNPFIPVYDPSHPDANEEGYVMYPNVNTAEEVIDLMAAQRAYETNVTAFNIVKSLAQKALEIGK